VKAANEADEGVEELEAAAQGTAEAGLQRGVSENLHEEMA